jgi:hypothetical protein
VTVLHVHEDVTLLSADAALVRMTTAHAEAGDLLVQRSPRPHGFPRPVLTLFRVLALLRAMLRQSYTARARNLALFEGDLMEAGAAVVVHPVPPRLFSLEALFRAAVAHAPAEWLARSAAPSFRANAAAFPADALKRAFAARLPRHFFLRMRPRLAQSLGLAALLRHVFGGRYPPLARVLLGAASDRVPLLPLDFEGQGGAPFRFSPVIAEAIGGGRTGEVSLAIAAAAKALTENVEAVRALVEVIVGDDDVAAGRARTMQELADERARIEARFVALCPPRTAGITPDAGAEWLATVERLVETAADADAQPIETIPWF